MEEKKHFKLRLKRDEVMKEKEAICYNIPNNKHINKIRNPTEYYKDQLKYDELKKQKIELIKQKEYEKESLELKSKPEINKNSDRIIRNINKEVRGKKHYGKIFNKQKDNEIRSIINKEVNYSKKVIDPVTKKSIILKAPKKKGKVNMVS